MVQEVNQTQVAPGERLCGFGAEDLLCALRRQHTDPPDEQRLHGRTADK